MDNKKREYLIKQGRTKGDLCIIIKCPTCKAFVTSILDSDIPANETLEWPCPECHVTAPHRLQDCERELAE